jgi:hypothetical protein
MKASLLLALLLGVGPGQLPDEAVNRADYAPCGLDSFFLVCRLLEVPVRWEEAKELLGTPGTDGTHSFADIARAGEAAGLYPVGLKTEVARLGDLPMPAIVHVRDPRRADNPPHLLVMLRCDAGSVILLDPPMPAYSLSAEQFATVWTGNILVFARGPQEAQRLRGGASRTALALAAILAAFLTGLLALGGMVVRWRQVGPSKSPRPSAVNERPGHERVRRILSWRRVAMGACLVIVVVGAVGLVGAFLPRERSPRCTLPDAEIELGELDPGTFQTRVSVRNDGTGPLAISAVRSSCTCASVKAPAQVEAGATSMLDVDLNISRGPQRAVLTIESNDPRGDKKLSLWWHGRSRPVLHPVRVVADAAPADQPFEKTLKLIYPGGEKAIQPHLERVECDSPHVTVREGQRQVVEGPGGYTFSELDFHVSITPPGPSGHLDTVCQLTIQQGDQTHQLAFLVSIQFLGGKVKPESAGVIFAATSPHDLVGQERMLRVAVPTGQSELDVAELPDWLTCDQEAEGESQRGLRFHLTHPPERRFTQHTVFLRLRGEPGPGVPVVIHCVASR